MAKTSAGITDISKVSIGDVHQISKISIGDKLVFSAGNTVTYYVDTNVTYRVEVDEGESVLSPASFTPAKAGWVFVGWREDKAANGSVLTSKVMADKPINLYAIFAQTITVTYYNLSTSPSYAYGNRIYNNGNLSNPSFTLAQTASSGWTARGWSASTAAAGGISYNNGASFTRSSSVTLYGMYYQTVTLSYNGNGSTSGSTAAQSGTRYYNSNGNVSNPSFTLRSNGFARTSYNFSKWAIGSPSGTQYAAGAGITLAGSTTMYAVWTYVGNPYSIVTAATAQVALQWTCYSGDSSKFGQRAWGEGWSGAPNIGVYGGSNTNFRAYSSAISTNGNRTLEIIANSNQEVSIYVPNVLSDFTVGSSYVYSGAGNAVSSFRWVLDVSKQSSINIYVGCGSTVSFYEIKLY